MPPPKLEGLTPLLPMPHALKHWYAEMHRAHGNFHSFTINWALHRPHSIHDTQPLKPPSATPPHQNVEWLPSQYFVHDGHVDSNTATSYNNNKTVNSVFLQHYGAAVALLPPKDVFDNPAVLGSDSKHITQDTYQLYNVCISPGVEVAQGFTYPSTKELVHSIQTRMADFAKAWRERPTPTLHFSSWIHNPDTGNRENLPRWERYQSTDNHGNGTVVDFSEAVAAGAPAGDEALDGVINRIFDEYQHADGEGEAY
jgi:hypothetical protein